eukprot:jgi/Bigna1/85122/estExt_fgenesh1_pg.C_20230
MCTQRTGKTLYSAAFLENDNHASRHFQECISRVPAKGYRSRKSEYKYYLSLLAKEKILEIRPSSFCRTKKPMQKVAEFMSREVWRDTKSAAHGAPWTPKATRGVSRAQSSTQKSAAPCQFVSWGKRKRKKRKLLRPKAFRSASHSQSPEFLLETMKKDNIPACLLVYRYPFLRHKNLRKRGIVDGEIENRTSEIGSSSTELNGRAADGDKGRNVKFAAFERHSKKFGSKMLAKWGFKGKLGINGRGLMNPIELQSKGALLKQRGPNVRGTHKRKRHDPEMMKRQRQQEQARQLQKENVPEFSELFPTKKYSLNRYRALIFHVSALDESIHDLNYDAWLLALQEYLGITDIRQKLPNSPPSPFLTDQTIFSYLIKELRDSGVEVSRALASKNLLAKNKDNIYLSLQRRKRAGNSAGKGESIDRKLHDLIVKLRWKMGYKVGVMHPGSQSQARNDLERLGLTTLVNNYVNASSALASTPPYRSMYDEILARMQVSSRHALAIASDPHEVIGSHAAKIACISLENSDAPLLPGLKDAQKIKYLAAPFASFHGSPKDGQRFMSYLERYQSRALPHDEKGFERLQRRLSGRGKAGALPCLAMDSRDGRLYDAQALKLEGGDEGDQCRVTCNRYGNTEILPLARVLFLDTT